MTTCHLHVSYVSLQSLAKGSVCSSVCERSIVYTCAHVCVCVVAIAMWSGVYAQGPSGASRCTTLPPARPLAHTHSALVMDMLMDFAFHVRVRVRVGVCVRVHISVQLRVQLGSSH